MLKNLFYFLFATSFLSSSFAKDEVITPSGIIDTELAIPIIIKIDSPRSDFTVHIQSDNRTLFKISKKGPIAVNLISTRFRGISNSVTTVISYNNQSPKIYKNELNLSSIARTPENSSPRISKIGDTTYDFKPRGTNFLFRKSQGALNFVIFNAASMSSFVNEALLELKEPNSTTKVVLNGSPYWYEPLIRIEGIFSDAEVLNIVSLPVAPKQEINNPADANPNSTIEGARNKCLNLGFPLGTEKFGECVLILSK